MACTVPRGGTTPGEVSVTDDRYDDDPWPDWLNGYLLTRADSLWLSDGVDRPALDVMINLLEEGEENLVITGDKAKLMKLIGIDSSIGGEIVVNGYWNSLDNIDVHITSSLISPRNLSLWRKNS